MPPVDIDKKTDCSFQLSLAALLVLTKWTDQGSQLSQHQGGGLYHMLPQFT